MWRVNTTSIWCWPLGAVCMGSDWFACLCIFFSAACMTACACALLLFLSLFLSLLFRSVPPCFPSTLLSHSAFISLAASQIPRAQPVSPATGRLGAGIPFPLTLNSRLSQIRPDPSWWCFCVTWSDSRFLLPREKTFDISPVSLPSLYGE